MTEKHHVDAAAALIEQAMGRLSKRTKAYKLLYRAHIHLVPYATLQDFTDLLKRHYPTESAVALGESDFLRMISK